MNKKFLCLLFLSVFVVWVSGGYLVFRFAEDYGRFGDMFGAVNALFSGLAFAGVIYTLYVQRRDTDKQNFQNLFFRRIQFHNDLVSKICGHVGSEKFFGNKLDELTRSIPNPANSGDASGGLDEIVDAYNRMYGTYTSDLGRYFRSLYYSMKFIQSGRVDKILSENEFDAYADIFRSCLTDSEILLIFYNCIGDDGELNNQKVSRKRMRELVVELKLVKHTGHMINQQHCQNKYAKEMLG